MRIELNEKQRETLIKKCGFIDHGVNYYKELTVFDIFIPLDEMYMRVLPTYDVDTEYGVTLDYKDEKLNLGMSSQKFDNIDDYKTFCGMIDYLKDDYKVLEKIFKIINENK